MFGFFNKKKPKTALDEFIFIVYGNPPPPKRANVEQAITLATNDLLMGVVKEDEVRKKAVALSSGPIPYSTHDLALSVALNFFRQPEYVPHLGSAQMMARLKTMQWLQEGLVVNVLVEGFEDVLYKLYKPDQFVKKNTEPRTIVKKTGPDKDLDSLKEPLARIETEDFIIYPKHEKDKDGRWVLKNQPSWQPVLDNLTKSSSNNTEFLADDIRTDAENGDTDAQCELGEMYKEGEGVQQSYNEAAKWFFRAAEQGHENAQYNLGFMYLMGKGVPRDDVEAARWYRMAAVQGNANAQYKIGLMYENGIGLPQDDTEAVKWYRKAAEQGDKEAQRNLDSMYEQGYTETVESPDGEYHGRQYNHRYNDE